MLFLTKNGFLEILSESQFTNVFTLHATDAADLVQFVDHTPATVLFNPRSECKYVLWMRKEIVAELLDFIPVLFETENTLLAVSKRVPLYLVEGVDPISNTPVKLLVSSMEFKGMQVQIDALIDMAMYPIYSSPEALMDAGGI